MSLTKQLREEEGEVLHAYEDHLGYLTIGVGRLIDKRKGGGITPEESTYLLNNDIKKATKAIERRIPGWSKLNDVRKGTLIGMAFQMGADGLFKFKGMLKCLELNDFDGAAKAMLDSLWAKQTPSRAKRLSEQMRTGVWHFK